MANDGGVWVKMGNAAPPGVAVIGTGSVGVDNNPNGKPSSTTNNPDGSYDYVDGDKTYRVYAFTTPTTRASIRLTDEARARITDEDLLMAVATTPIPDDFTEDPVKLFDRKYRNQLRNAFEITPAVNPGLTLDVDSAGMADVLLIGGGGAGGSHRAGGGGAGGHHYITNAYLPTGSLTVTVGSGGAGFDGGGSSFSSPGRVGNASRLDSYYSPGGGGGASMVWGVSSNATYIAGLDGASGGGGTYQTTGGSGLTGIGHAGGSGDTGTFGFGGGGGAGGVGSPGFSAANGGDGGAGLANSITGSSVTRAGGGGGGGDASAGAGGTGGGGAGAVTGTATSGTANTGSGGGGLGSSTHSTSGSGGSGIVIVRVEI